MLGLRIEVYDSKPVTASGDGGTAGARRADVADDADDA